MKKLFFSGCLVALVISLALSQVCFAKQDTLGKITSVSGSVEIKREKETQWMRAERNMPVYYGDDIKTSEDGNITITFLDESLMTVQPNTHVALNTIISPLEKRNSVLLFFGRIWNKVRSKVVQMRGYEVQTPTAVLGVRGTEFEAASYEDGTTLVRVASGGVSVDSETESSTLSEKQGAQVSIETKRIKTETDFRPEWKQAEINARKSLFADGRRYGVLVHSEIRQRRDNLKTLVDEVKALTKKRERYRALAKEAEQRGDQVEYEFSMAKARETNREILELNKKIAFSGRRLECQFGLFDRYGYLAKHPELSKEFRGKEFILEQLDDIEMIRAEFNAMIEEGMKLSMEDMEDLMDEMKEKVDQLRKGKEKSDPFEELNGQR
ncbi:MAG TPA: FecR family protein [Desulfatiglandales bacterium]|nr:FecR family protein [Desulfatiglandales bacterium]